MSSGQNWSELVGLLGWATGEGAVCPTATVLVARGTDIVFEHCSGKQGAPNQETSCNEQAVFDLASLTKPLVTAALVLNSVARERISLDTKVAQIVPEFADAAGGPADERRGTVRIRDLLRHDSGLPAYRRFFERFEGRAPDSAAKAEAQRREMLSLVLHEPLERDPRTMSVYSDLGFVVLGEVLERLTGTRIDELARTRLFEPLGIGDARFFDVRSGADPLFAPRIVATGPCEWRRREVHGVVQDENAYAMGGIAAHAGLFATARDVPRLAAEWMEAWCGRGRVLDRRLVVHAWNPLASTGGAPPSTWALGWDTPTPGSSSAGSLVGRDAVGHLGYTGTSIWLDPSRRAHVVLLTNRVAYGRNSEPIRALRPRVHDAVFAALDRTKR
jgi:CubicO group peptidase (beta-lactamase class C family)